MLRARTMRVDGAKLVRMADTVRYDCVDHVATITYHRPRR